MTFNVFDDDDCVIDHQSDRQHDCEQSQQVEAEGADQRNGYGNDRYNHRPERSEEKENNHHHDEQRVDQHLHHFVNGVVDIGGGVVSHLGRHPGGELFLDLLQLSPDPLDHVNRVGVRQYPDAHEYRFLTGETDLSVVILSA